MELFISGLVCIFYYSNQKGAAFGWKSLEINKWNTLQFHSWETDKQQLILSQTKTTVYMVQVEEVS